MKIEHEQGYLVIAQNNKNTDYVACARALAKSIRHVEPNARICLLTDDAANGDDVFDIVKTFPFGDQSQLDEWKLHNDWQCFYASPFRQTIKIEADMLIPKSISHWFDICSQKDLVVTIGARNYHNRRAQERQYRRIFDENRLPDVYNAITYWRLSPVAQEFFDTVRHIFENWSKYMDNLRFAANQPVNTDLAYAIAMVLLGPEKYTLPGDVPSLIHMKRSINGLETENWTRELVWEFNPGSFRINTVEQLWPVHYHVKSFAKHVEEYYDNN